MSRGFHSRWWRGTNAERVGFATADLTTPFWWFETDTEDIFFWDGTAWVGATVGGVGAATEVAYWTGASMLAGDAGMTYAPGTDTLSVGNVIVPSLGYAGLGPAAGRLVFEDTVGDEARFEDCTWVGIENILYHIGDADTYLIFSPDFAGFRVGNLDFLYMAEHAAAQDEFEVNPGGVDIDFIVQAVGVANALVVRGSDGQITLGVLGAGAVQSTAGGVLSSGALPLTDLASYTQGDLIYGGAADWQDLAHPGAANRVLQSTAAEVGWSAQAVTFPAAGAVPTGTGVNTQVAYWTAASTLAGDAGLTYNAATNALTLVGIIRFEAAAPLNVFRETDQGLPAGLWRYGFDADAFLIDQNTAVAGDFSTFVRRLALLPSGNFGINVPLPTARIHAHEATVLGGAQGNSQILATISGHGGANEYKQSRWLFRDAAGADWTTTRLHDAISIAGVFVTPGVDTKVWWERDPSGDIQSWGNAAVTYMTLAAGALGIGIAPVVGLHYASNSPQMSIQDLNGAGDAANPWINFGDSVAHDTLGLIGYGSPAHSDLVIVNKMNANIRFYTNADEVVRFHASGGVSIGDGYVATDPGVNNLIVEGILGIGLTSPQGRLHGYDTISGFLHWEYDGVDGVARTVVPNGAGDVVYALSGLYQVRVSDGNVAAGYITAGITPGNSVSIYDDFAGNVLTLAVAADGSVTVQRTAGALTYKVGLWLIWL